MIPRRLPANGVPWLCWLGTGAWQCSGCGQGGAQPPLSDVAAFARWAGDLKRSHAGCGRPIPLRAGEVGHPLNPDRSER